MVSVAPDRAVLIFNEPVTVRVLRLVTPDGQSIPAGGEARNNAVVVSLPPLQPGTHLLSWRVTSADGHPVGGTLTFSVGRIGGAASPADDASIATRLSIFFARLTLYLCTFAALGAAAFSVWIAPLQPRLRKLSERAAFAGIAAAAISAGLHGADVLGVPLRDLATAAPWIAATGTSFLATVLLIATALGLAVAALRRPRPVLTAVALAVGGIAFAASGHAANAPPQWLARPALASHAICVALWAGSLLPLYHSLVGSKFGTILARFSSLIAVPVAILLGSGIVLAVLQLDDWTRIASQPYGQIFILKMIAVAALLGLAVYNRTILTPRIRRGRKIARKTLARTIGAEVVLMAVVLALVGLWRFTPPPRALGSTEPAFVHIHARAVMADVTLSPGRAGPVTLTLKVMRDDFSALEAKEVTLLMANGAAGIEPLRRTARLGSDGLWSVDGLILPVSGRWDLQIDVLVTDFEKVVLDGPILVAP